MMMFFVRYRNRMEIDLSKVNRSFGTRFRVHRFRQGDFERHRERKVSEMEEDVWEKEKATVKTGGPESGTGEGPIRGGCFLRCFLRINQRSSSCVAHSSIILVLAAHSVRFVMM